MLLDLLLLLEDKSASAYTGSLVVALDVSLRIVDQQGAVGDPTVDVRCVDISVFRVNVESVESQTLCHLFGCLVSNVETADATALLWGVSTDNCAIEDLALCGVHAQVSLSGHILQLCIVVDGILDEVQLGDTAHCVPRGVVTDE